MPKQRRACTVGWSFCEEFRDLCCLAIDREDAVRQFHEKFPADQTPDDQIEVHWATENTMRFWKLGKVSEQGPYRY